MAQKRQSSSTAAADDGRHQGELQKRVDKELTIRKLSHRAAAKESGVTNTVWSSWLRGDEPPSNKLAAAVAAVLDWPLDWPDNLPPAPVGALESLQADVRRLIVEVGELSSLVRQDLENR